LQTPWLNNLKTAFDFTQTSCETCQWRIHIFLGGAEGDVSPLSYFIANAYNELCALYAGKGELLKKI